MRPNETRQSTLPLENSSSPCNKALLAHPGTQYAMHLARQLDRVGSLSRFWTCFALKEKGLASNLMRLLPARGRKWLGNREVIGLGPDKLRTVPLLEIMATLKVRFGADVQAVLHKRNESFQRAIPDEEIARGDVVIGFDTSSNILVDRAARLGRPLILDQTIAHPRAKAAVYDRIRKQFPDWSADLEERLHTVTAGEDYEHQKSHRITVASSFTKTTLVDQSIDPDKIALNPYGVDLQRFSRQHQPPTGRPFRFVFAGLVCARKGIPLLLQAWSALQPKDAELWIVGPITPVAAANISELPQVKILGKLPNADLASIMAKSDVFVFPSYFEGFGLVLLEAMAAGLPVLTTTATAGPDLITQDHDGWVTEPGDLDVLVDAMQFCLQNRDRIAAMGKNARATAERFSWDAYGDRWRAILERKCNL
jgi:starch synthase